MENKNLNDIIIEDAETSKGNQLKNILTLLALLFIILVISIVITKLILGGDDDDTASHLRADGTVQELGEHNLTGSNGLATSGTGHAIAAATGAALLGGAAATTVALTSKKEHTTSSSTEETLNPKTPVLAERNTTSRTKAPLRTEHPVKSTTKSASTSSETTKKATSSSHHVKKHHSTYTRPKYVKNRTTTNSTTKKSTPKHISSKKVTRGYYIKVGAFSNPSTAIKNIKSIKLNYKTKKIKHGLTRVLIGPFYSQRDAQNHLAKAKANVAADAYIAKIK